MTVASFANQLVKLSLKKTIIPLLFSLLVEAPWVAAAPSDSSKYSKVDLHLDLGQAQKAASLMRNFKDKTDPGYHYYQAASPQCSQNQQSIQHFQTRSV